MTLQERLAKTQGQDNGMDIILGGIPAAAQQEQVQQHSQQRIVRKKQ